MSVKETFGDKLKRLRGSISQEELGKELGYSRASIGYYENGKRTPDIEFLTAVAKHFNVSLDYLLGFSSYRPLNEQESSEYFKFLLKQDTTGKLNDLQMAIFTCWKDNFNDKRFFSLWFQLVIQHFINCLDILNDLLSNNDIYYNFNPNTWRTINKINFDANSLIEKIVESYIDYNGGKSNLEN